MRSVIRSVLLSVEALPEGLPANRPWLATFDIEEKILEDLLGMLEWLLFEST